MTNLRLTVRTFLALTALASALLLGACSKDSADTLVKSGKGYAARADHAAAIIQYKTALQSGTDTAEIRWLLGRSLLSAANPQPAIVELNKALEAGYPKDEVVPLLAQALVMLGDYRKLTTSFEGTQLTDKLANASLNASLATAWAALGDPAKGEAALAAALRALPEYGPALVMRARLVGVKGDLDGALSIVEQVLKRDANAHEAHQLKGEILLLGKKDEKGGEASIRQALEIDKAYLPAHAMLIGLALDKRDIKGAKAQATLLRAVQPKSPQTAYLEAQIAFYEGDFTKAQELANSLMRVASENISVLQLAGSVEAQIGSMVIAESIFSKALLLEPGSTLTRQNLAIAYVRLGQPAKALETLRPLTGEGSADIKSLKLAGEAALRMEDPRAAETFFLRASKVDPNDPQIRTKLAVTQLNRGEVSRGFAELQALSDNSKDTTADMAIVSARVKRREWDAALAGLDAITKKDPKNGAIPELRGRILVARGNLPGARTAFEEALALDPKLFAAVSYLAELDLLEKKPEQARRRLEDTMRTEPRNHFAGLALAQLLSRLGAPLDEQRAVVLQTIKANPSVAAPRLRLVELNLANRRYTEALAAAQEAAAALPNDANVLDALGRSLTQTGDIQQAISTFKRLNNLDSKAVLPHTRLADLYKSTGDRKSAQASWRRVLEIEPDSDLARVSLIELMLADKRPADAMALAREIQKNRPASATGHLFEGALHHRQRELDKALAAYRAGLQREPRRSELGVRVHQTLSATGRTAEATQFASGWAAANPNDSEFGYQAAVTYLNRGDIVSAEQRFRALADMHPNHALALNNLAWTMVQLGKPGAVAYAERANAIAPNRPAVMDTLAGAMAAEDKVEQALGLQKSAAALAPNEPALRLNLAKIALKAGDKTLARTELEALAKRGQQFSAHEEVSKLLKSL